MAAGRASFCLPGSRIVSPEKCDHRLQRSQRVPGERIEAGDALDFVAEELDAQARPLGVGRTNLHGVAAHAKFAALEGDVVARIAGRSGGAEHSSRLICCPTFSVSSMLRNLPAADAVDAGDTGDDNHIAPREEGTHGREPQALDLLVHAGILLDEGVGARDVGLGLVIIEVADEIFDRVVWKEAFELRVELRRQRFVVRDDQRRPFYFANDIRDGEGFPRAGHAEEGLVFVTRFYRLDQLADSLTLVALRLISGFELKPHPPK